MRDEDDRSDICISTPTEQELSDELVALVTGMAQHPLAQVATIIMETALRNDAASRHVGISIAHFLLQLIPKLETDSLHIDLFLIQGVARQLTGVKNLERLIIPVYEELFGLEWGHAAKELPIDARSRLAVHLIFMNRAEGQQIDLLEYPWLVHELVHYAFSTHLNLFDPGHQLLSRRVNQWALAGLAVDDPVGEHLAEDFKTYWSPSETQLDWPHEIAVDTICMLLLGPVYTSALYRHYADTTATVNAYQIESRHLPIELRTQAMIRLGEELGWGEEIQPLRALQRQWQEQWPEAARASRYRNLRDQELITEAQLAARKYAASMSLTQLTPEHLDEVAAVAEDVSLLQGLDMIISAYCIYQKYQGGEGYTAWTTRLIQSFADD